ncbi:ABC transporter ATP-binding protein [Lichenifustis flavocetrariae]|uniref:ABC transporter ATP-binding protein n=1 Tax=Lichenifustis flavocetrariae TaxID=2949735 RepID=A0AA41Z1D6_9HYPH|nr:ABC transporter ATP-binding protein [Lichenifustis flavocetrariae]MCW6508605.1 ABC transporter ATP-binding protein [Lichenifustis flavocetrariae]
MLDRTPSEPLLSVDSLTVSFRTEHGLITAVDKVSFAIRPGELVSLVGESGSGKSLTSLAVMGLITDPNAILTGSIRYKGRELVGLSRHKLQAVRGNEIAMIFQDPMSAMTPVYTIGWQIAEQLRAHRKLTKKQARTRAIELLAEMGMPSPEVQVDRYPHQLSGGMRQRAMIAMALSCDPSLLIADEPTTALDVTVQAQILRLIEQLQRNHGSAVILVTHDMGVVAEVADRVMVMYAGRIVEEGPKEPVFMHPGHPYTEGLLRSIPPMHGVRPHRLIAIPGAPPSPANRPPGCRFSPRCAYRYEPCGIDPPLFRKEQQDIACYRAEALLEPVGVQRP